MFNFIKDSWDSVKQFCKSLFILSIVPVSVAILDIAGFLTGSLLAPAVMSGIIFVVSILFVSVNLSSKLRRGVYKFVGSYGGWLDLIATVVVTCIGFQVGVTMALALMMLGLNLSALFSIIRLSQILTDPKVRQAFAIEMGGKATAKPKRRTKLVIS